MTDNKPSLSIIMPAYNEAQGIRGAYESTTRSAQQAGIDDYEILIITDPAPDGTHDGTPDIAEQIAKEDKKVKHIFHKKHVSLGFCYRSGVEMATKDYVIWVPGDNDIMERSLINILKHLGEAPLIIVYTLNPEGRPLYMRFVSRGFVWFWNIVFLLRMKYYNGMNILPRALLKKIPMSANNPSFMAEILTYLLKSGIRYIEIPQEIKYTPYPGKTFRISSVWQILTTIPSLFWKIHFQRIRIDITDSYK